MKILRLELRAFGPFTDVSLDLSGANEGLHIIYGPNEAGKSSALRAIEQMFFGIPGNSADNFIHPYPKLRIGAVVADRQGRCIEFLRRKGTKGTLLECDNKTPLEENVLAEMLGGLSRESFVGMFGIDHEELVQGGQGIVAGHGEIGQLLFAAGSGISRLHAMRRELTEDAEGLFTPRGHTRQINRQLKALEETKRGIRQSQLPGTEWERHRRALDDAEKRLADVGDRLGRLSRERSRLERIHQALPILTRRREKRQQLDEMGEVTMLPPGFADQGREALTNLKLARQQHDAASQELERIDRAAGEIVVPEAVIAQAKGIEALPDALGSHRKAQRDLGGLQTEKQQHEARAAAILHELRPDLSLEMAEGMQLTVAQRVEIQDLSSRYESLLEQAQRAKAEIRDAESQRDETKAELALLELPRDAAALRSAVRRTQHDGDIEGQRAAARAESEGVKQAAAVELSKLGLWSGTLEELETLAVPSSETVDRFEDQLATAARAVESLADKVEEANGRRSDSERQMEEFRLAGDVPSEEELRDARGIRDQGWQVIRDEWQKGESDGEKYDDFLAYFEGQIDLVAAYEQAVGRADLLADRLRREADRVAKRAGLRARCAELDREIVARTEQLQSAQEHRERLGQQWAECWRPAKIVPLTPREMHAWLRSQHSLVEKAVGIRQSRSQVEELDRRINARRGELGHCLAELGERPDDQGESLAALVDRCQQVADHVDAVAARRAELEREIRRLDHCVTEAQSRAEQTAADRAEWNNAWAAAIEALGLTADAAPSVVNRFLARLDELFEEIRNARDKGQRIEMIGHDAAAFRRQVADVVRGVDPALVELPCEEAAQELVAGLNRARADHEKRQTLLEQRSRFETERDQAGRRVEELTAKLSTMCEEAGCQAPEELSQAEQRSSQARQWRDAVSELDDQLAGLSGGAAVDAFVAEVEEADADNLPGRIETLGGEIEQLEDERGGLRETIGSEKKELERMDTGAEAAEAEEAKQHLLARIGSDVEQYVRLRLASTLLREAVERYQKRSEAPVLRRASELFRRLTGGSFEQLLAGYDSTGDKVLLGDRGTGSEPVALAGMSDGTCDQLYLALRLASLEHYLAEKEPIPFIVDDVLISFDDERATAALGVLAEISRRTQVIFFTHHQHLVRLAEDGVDEEALVVHQLAGRTSRAVAG